MSTQMTLRVGDAAAEQIDRMVTSGLFPSRAAYVTWLAEKDAMLQRSLADLAVLREAGGSGYPELESMHRFAADNVVPLA